MVEKSFIAGISSGDPQERSDAFGQHIILDTTRDVYAKLDKKGIFQYANPSFQKILNYSNDELMDKSIVDYLHPDDRDRVMQSFVEMEESASVKTFFRFRDRTGHYIWFEIWGGAIQNGENAEKFITLLCREIAGNEHAEEDIFVERIIFEKMIEGMPGIFCCVDDQLQIKKWNKNFERVSGYSAQELYGMSPLVFIAADARKFMEGRLDEAFIRGEISGEADFISRDGRKIPYLFHIYPIILQNRMHLIGIGIDLSNCKRADEELRKSKERFDIAIAGLEAGVWDWDMLEDTVVYSAQWKGMLGYEDAEIENSFNGWKKIWHPDDAADIEKTIYDLLQGESERYEIVYRCRHKSGDWRWFVTRGKILRHEGNAPYRWVGTNIDITQLKQAEEKIQYLAYHDSLTDLPNRKLFFDRLGIALALAHRNQSSLAILMLDLDNFKQVNDTFGHAARDNILKAAAGRLTSVLRKGDTVARFGGDEFVLILPDLKEIDDAINVAGKVVDAFRNPFAIETRQIPVTASVGIAIYPHDGTNEDDLLKNADTAMYRVKQTGRNRYQACQKD